MTEEDPVVMPIGREFDLHTFRPNEIPEATRAYLDEARVLGYTEVRIIHGKGTGYQRDVVRQVLAATTFVDQFADDVNGNRGATWVRLRQN